MINTVFARACELAMALGHERINELPGCLELEVDEHWRLTINPHPYPTASSTCKSVPGCTVYFERDGWPAGMVNSAAGTMLGLGNEDQLIEALEYAALKAQGAIQ